MKGYHNILSYYGFTLMTVHTDYVSYGKYSGRKKIMVEFFPNNIMALSITGQGIYLYDIIMDDYRIHQIFKSKKIKRK